jgi:hypothetical protein
MVQTYLSIHSTIVDNNYRKVTTLTKLLYQSFVDKVYRVNTYIIL